jgi:NDP-sugar pyrophosphorylase family protein
VGDSILGHKAHLGAGVILSNVRLDQGEVIVRGPVGGVATGLKKFGAIIGDRAEVVCNSVLSPGSIVGREAVIHPCVHWKGVLPARTVAKLRQNLEQAPRV